MKNMNMPLVNTLAYFPLALVTEKNIYNINTNSHRYTSSFFVTAKRFEYNSHQKIQEIGPLGLIHNICLFFNMRI